MKFVPLRDIADIQLGKMLSPTAKTGKEPYPYLRNQNVQWGRFELQDMATMDFSEQDREKFELLVGDVLICEGGEPGRCAVWDQQIDKCFYQKALHRVRPRRGRSTSEFLSMWIRYQAQTGAFEEKNAKTTIAHLPLVRLEQLLVPDIDTDAQKAIAKRLKAQMVEAEHARQAARTQLREISNLAGAIVMETIRNMPTKPYQLGDVLDEVKKGIGASWADHPVLGATREGLAPAKEQPGKMAPKYKPVTPGTVFYNPMRILIGSIAFVDDDDAPGITSPDYVALRGKPGLVDSRWFYYWLRSHLGAQCILSLARGAVRERMLFNRLADGKIDLPSPAAQEKASRALRELKPLQRALKSKLAEIDLLPQKILAQAFEM